MNTFKAYMLKKAYERYQKLGDKLAKIEPLIDWEAFRPIITPMYHNETPRGGRPNVDEVMMMKLLVLQQFHRYPIIDVQSASSGVARAPMRNA